MEITKTAQGISITCQAVFAGDDLNLTIYGGERPHIGCVVLSIPRPSLTGTGTGVTSSVLNLPGHKEESVARMFAEYAAKKYGRTTCCTCGIHMDQATKGQLKTIEVICGDILKEFDQWLKDSKGKGV
ncbi:MAG TPA: hypothetical protein DCF42_04570 [Lachnospiraceae bacterium]|nr:hypothetical protein [Lachnospiraceae bacterium]